MVRSRGAGEYVEQSPLGAGLRASVLAALLIGATVAAGWVAALGNPLYLLLPPVVLAALVAAGQPVLLLWTALVGGLAVAGTLALYLPQLELARWLLTPVGFLLLLHALLGGLDRRLPGRGLEMPTALRWALAFLAVALLASLLAGTSGERLAIGLKGYFQIWGLLFGLAFFGASARHMDRLPRVLLAIGLVQIPFVIHQYLFLVPQRVGLDPGIVPVDVVAGTFGASLYGGGANALLNAFLVTLLAGLVAAYRSRAIPARAAWPLGLLLAAPLLLNQAKVTVVYLALLFFAIYGPDMFRRPWRFLAGALGVSALLGLLVLAFVANAPPDADIESPEDLARHAYEYNAESDELGGRLTRGGAIAFWADRHGAADPLGTLLGHGVGFTRVADAHTPWADTAQIRTPGGIAIPIDLTANIGATAVTALLWETGVVGLVCIFGLLLATFFSAGRLAKRHAAAPERAAALRAAQVGALILMTTLAHKNLFVLDAIYQTFVAAVVGYVAYWERQARLGDRAARRSSSPSNR